MELIRDAQKLDLEFPLRIYSYIAKPTSSAAQIMHWHDYFEITLVQKGAGTYFANGRTYAMQPGDLIVFNTAEPHSWLSMEEDMHLLVLIFQASLVSGNGRNLDAEYLRPLAEVGSRFQNRIAANAPYADVIGATLLEIDREWHQQSQGYQLMIKSDLLRILTLLVRHYPDLSKTCDPLARRKQAYLRISEALRYLDAHFSEQVSLSGIAAICCMNPSYFSDCFHKVTGESFVAYLTRLRIEQACVMLKHSELSVTEVGYACGFQNASSFYRAYHRYGQGTPSHPELTAEPSNGTAQEAP